MKNALLSFGLVAFFSVVAGKSDYFPDLPEEDYKKLEEIARFLQKRVEEAAAAEEAPEPEVQSQSSKNELNPPFEYNLPTASPEDDDLQPFAVGPFDPRYYQDFGREVEPTRESFEEPKDKRPQTDSSEIETSSKMYDQVYSSVRRVPLTGDEESKADIYFTAIVAGCSAAAVVAIVGIGIGCYRLAQKGKNMLAMI